MTYASLEAALLELMARPPDPDAADDTEFNALALKIHRYQRENNEPYARFCEFSRAPLAPADWREIPAVPTGAFRHAALRTFTEAETVATFRTSGTTGEGFGSHHFCSLWLYEASILRAWARLALPPLPQILLVPRPADAPHSSLSHMMGTLGVLAPQTWCLQGHRLDLDAFRRATEHGPVFLLGTALAFLHLFEQLEGSPLALAPGSLALETGGYKGTGRSLTKAALYAQFRHALGLEPGAILNEYSMTELSSQWYARGLDQPHHGPAWTRALVIDPETGREVAEGAQGVVRLFDLANLGSVLAIQTQDLAVRRGGGFELLGRDPAAIPRGCSRSADELLQTREPR